MKVTSRLNESFRRIDVEGRIDMKPLRNVSAPCSGRTALVCLAVLTLGACDQVDQIQNGLRDQTPHEAYMESLRAVKLSETALGTQWASAAVRSLRDAPIITLPFEEEGFLFAETPEARSYRVELRRGQRLSIDADLDGARSVSDVHRRVPDAGGCLQQSPSGPVLRFPNPRLSSTSPRGEPNTSCECNPSSSTGAGIGSSFAWTPRSRFPCPSGTREPS